MGEKSRFLQNAGRATSIFLAGEIRAAFFCDSLTAFVIFNK